MKHPFSDEDIDAAFENLGMDKKGLRLAIYYLWDSAVKRGAVREMSKGNVRDMDWQWPSPEYVSGYFIKLPEEKS